MSRNSLSTSILFCVDYGTTELLRKDNCYPNFILFVTLLQYFLSFTLRWTPFKKKSGIMGVIYAQVDYILFILPPYNKQTKMKIPPLSSSLLLSPLFSSTMFLLTVDHHIFDKLRERVNNYLADFFR